MSVNDHGSLASIEFGLINKFEQVGKFTITESVNHEDGLSVTNNTSNSLGAWLKDSIDQKRRQDRVSSLAPLSSMIPAPLKLFPACECKNWIKALRRNILDLYFDCLLKD